MPKFSRTIRRPRRLILVAAAAAVLVASTACDGSGGSSGAGTVYTGNLSQTWIAVATEAYKVGFRGNGQVMAVAVSYAESGFNPHARGYNKSNGTTDRGWFQLNDSIKPYSDIPDSCADNLHCAMGVAFQHTNAGRSWGDWCSTGIRCGKDRVSQFKAKARAAVSKANAAIAAAAARAAAGHRVHPPAHHAPAKAKKKPPIKKNCSFLDTLAGKCRKPGSK